MISRLIRISDRAKSNAAVVFNNLFSVLTLDLLQPTLRKTNKVIAAAH